MNASKTQPGTLHEAMAAFASQMTGWHGICDGSLTARIVGEFSAGKTRLVNELLGDMVPQALKPISSREVQTRLPLEVTYGAQAALHLVERECDTDQATVVRALAHFPQRGEILAADYAPQRFRLRLSLPMQQLVLPEGDGYMEGNAPKRLFLIDMPGWNSSEDTLAEQPAELMLAGDNNLALVYVVSAMRLESSVNRQRLHDFLEALNDAYFLGQSQLLMVMTHCPEEDQQRLRALAACLVSDIWTKLGLDPDELELTVLCVEFDSMDALQLQAFRARFWQCLLAPLGQVADPGHPWQSRMRAWPEAWQLAPRVAASHRVLVAVRGMLAGICDQGVFLPGMNMRRLDGAEQEEIQSTLFRMWSKRARVKEWNSLLETSEDLLLAADHPLAAWWNLFWVSQTNSLLDAVHDLMRGATQALEDVSAQTVDLEAHLAQRLRTLHAAASMLATGSFARLVDAVHAAGELPAERLLASLFSLATVQTYYESQCGKLLQKQLQEETP